MEIREKIGCGGNLGGPAGAERWGGISPFHWAVPLPPFVTVCGTLVSDTSVRCLKIIVIIQERTDYHTIGLPSNLWIKIEIEFRTRFT